MRTDAAVREVLVEKGRAVGVVDRSRRAPARELVVSNLNPSLLFGRLVDPGVLPADFRERIERYRSGSGTFRMNVALSELPRFTCLPGGGRSPDRRASSWRPASPTWTRAYADARADGWSKAPIVEMLIPSTLDDSLAPAGRHVASLFCQHVAPALCRAAAPGTTTARRWPI